jgi:predicted DNA binding CopG/RHH family protein
MTTKKPNRIPEFTSIEEEAEFWDTHETTDFEDEFTPVKVRFAKHLSEGITIRLDPDTLAQLRSRAHEKGIGPTTLARMWILERLQRHEAVAPVDSPATGQ